MTDKKTAPAKKASKPAAAKTTAPKAAAPKATAAKAEAAPKVDTKAKNTATVNIHSDSPDGQRGFVDVAVNGKVSRLKTGSEVDVSEAVLEALSNSNHRFDIVSPLAGAAADEGSSAAATTLTGTAMRDEPPVANKADPATEPHELSQVSDNNLAERQQGDNKGDETPAS